MRYPTTDASPRVRHQVGSFDGREAETRKGCRSRVAVTVPQTDTGRWVEKTQVSERILVKELGKKAVVSSEEGLLMSQDISRSERMSGDCLSKT